MFSRKRYIIILILVSLCFCSAGYSDSSRKMDLTVYPSEAGGRDIVSGLINTGDAGGKERDTDNEIENGDTGKKCSGEACELFAKGRELSESDPLKALLFYQKALELDPENIDALQKTGGLCWDLNRFDEALRYLENARELLDKRGRVNTAQYAETLNSIGLLYRSLSDYEKALEHYFKAQKIRENLDLKSTVDYAETSSNIGIVYTDTARYDRALEYYSISQKILEEIKFQNSSKYAVLLNNIGGVFWSKGDTDSALVYYLMSQNIRDRLELQNTAGYAYLMNNIGGVFWKKGDNVRAVLYYEKSLAIRERLGLQNTESYCTLLNNIALTYYRRFNDPCKAAGYMKKCVDLDRTNGFLRLSSDEKDLKEMQDACRNK